MAMSNQEIIQLIIDSSTAIGTVAVAVIAIWGDKLRSWLAPAKLVIEPVEAEVIRGHHAILKPPTNVIIAGQTYGAMWYVLKVTNKRSWITAKNCRVILKGISRRGPDLVYHPETFSVPRQYWWAPSESTPTLVNVGKEQAFDFGYVTNNKDAFFTPTLYSTPNKFPGYVGPGESVRFSLEIDSDNFSSPQSQVFEVSWDGQWNENPEIMAKHLTIKEIVQVH